MNVPDESHFILDNSSLGDVFKYCNAGIVNRISRTKLVLSKCYVTGAKHITKTIVETFKGNYKSENECVLDY